MRTCVSLCRCGCVCMNSYCLLGDYEVTVLFVEMYVNVVFVKSFIQRKKESKKD